jgi:hypothetical protein
MLLRPPRLNSQVLAGPPTTLVEWIRNIICERFVVNFDNKEAAAGDLRGILGVMSQLRARILVFGLRSGASRRKKCSGVQRGWPL